MIESCSAGTYYNLEQKSDKTTCSKCPKDTYQNEIGRFHCKKCPQGKFTIGPNTKNATECRGMLQKYTTYNVYLMLIPRRWFSGGTKTGVAGEKPSKHALLTLSLSQTCVEILCGVRCTVRISITPKPNHETRRCPHGTKVLVSHRLSGRNGG